MLKILAALCLFASVSADIATRSTKVEGHFKCGSADLVGAHVRLFRSESEKLEDVIATGKTDSNGRFSIEGDTSRFGGEASAIDPYLRIYHKCDEDAGKSGFRTVEIRYPRDFVTLGKLPRRTYNLGLLNLEIIYPGEKRSNPEGLN
ncbi:Trans-thyretin-related family domain family member [Aphelenchoides bicaudatus]|nr:Trans-thyretin-related family domain family member [Aphelenchoides bicaudatus]